MLYFVFVEVMARCLYFTDTAIIHMGSILFWVFLSDACKLLPEISIIEKIKTMDK